MEQSNKVVRTICCFNQQPQRSTVEQLDHITRRLEERHYVIQTRRICSGLRDIKELEKRVPDQDIFFSVGTLDYDTLEREINNFYNSRNVAFNIDLTTENIAEHHVDILFNIIRHLPEKTFHFTYVFNNQPSSPYFPSATYERDGFSIGLQPTDLSEGCPTLDAWLQKIKMAWDEIAELFQDDRAFLGIDASIAPLFTGKSSLVHIIERLGVAFPASVITDLYVTITDFLQRHNPKPVGLCGLMLPCLEDFALAAAYEQGHFSIERNIYLSLHSGLGIDTYPIGLDERPDHVLNILKLLQGLSHKYGKTLSARFVSDGHATIGDLTSFRNPYLKDVTIRPLIL